MSAQIRRVTSLSDPAFEGVAQVIHDSFEPGYIAQAISPRGELDPSFHERRYRHVAVWGVLDLETYVASLEGSEEGEAHGVLILQPPGTKEPTPHAETAESKAVLDEAPPHIREALENMHHHEHEAQWTAFPKCDEMYWVAFLATTPAAQGKGLGKALLKSVLERAAKEGRTVALLTQTAENVAYYKRFGFVVHDETSSDIRGTTISYWTMSWTPEQN